MSATASQITSIWTDCSAVCSGVYQRKHQSSALLALCEGNSPITGFHLMTSSCFGNGSMSTTGEELVLCTKEIPCIGFNSLRPPQNMVFSNIPHWKCLHFDSSWFPMRTEQNMSLSKRLYFDCNFIQDCSVDSVLPLLQVLTWCG